MRVLDCPNKLLSMSEFRSWRIYHDFARKVKHYRRYWFDDETRKFLNSLISTIEEDQNIILQAGDNRLVRARIGHDWRYSDQIEGEVPAPFPPEQMKPYEGMQTEGRANPRGMPYLYLSTSVEAVIGEVRPWVGAYVTVAKFAVTRPLKLINLHPGTSRPASRLYLREPDAEEKRLAVWDSIDRAFSLPQSRSDDLSDYIPTQVVAEVFKSNGYDGIVYRSAFDQESHNICLFYLNAADPTGSTLHEITNMVITHSQAG